MPRAHPRALVLGALTLLVPSVAAAQAPIAAVPGAWSALARLVGLTLGLVLVAFLLGRYAPDRRRRLKSTVVLLGLYAASVVVALACDALEFRSPAGTAHWFGHLFHALVLIHLATIAVFDLVLRGMKLTPAVIISDVVLGFGYIAALLDALHDGGVNLSGLIATSAVVSGVLGLSLAPTIGNILGGVALQLDDSIHEGDWIQLDANTQGRVKSIRWRHTVIETRNWDSVIVPNATLLSANITILGKRTDQPVQRRYWVYFNVDFRYPPAEVIRVVDEALRESPIPNVADAPRPHTICYDLAKDTRDSFAYYAVRYWLTDLAVDDPTNSLVRARIHAALRRAGIPLALPASTLFVTMDDDEHAQRKTVREHARRVALLSSLELFRDFTPEEVSRLAHGLQAVPFAPGEVMTRQGRQARYLYILSMGEAEVQVSHGDGPPKKVATIKAPDYFGEMAVMTGSVRTATVIATRASECLRLDRAVFRAILAERKELAERLSEVLARRRSELDAVLEDLDGEQQQKRMSAEKVRLVNQIERFFGLADEDRD